MGKEQEPLNDSEKRLAYTVLFSLGGILLGLVAVGISITTMPDYKSPTGFKPQGPAGFDPQSYTAQGPTKWVAENPIPVVAAFTIVGGAVGFWLGRPDNSNEDNP